MIKLYLTDNPGELTADPEKASLLPTIKVHNAPGDIISDNDLYWEKPLHEQNIQSIIDHHCPSCGERYSSVQLKDGSVAYIDYPCNCLHEVCVADLIKAKGRYRARGLFRELKQFLKVCYLFNKNPLPVLREMFGRDNPINVRFWVGDYSGIVHSDVSMKSIIEGRAIVLVSEDGDVAFEIRRLPY